MKPRKLRPAIATGVVLSAMLYAAHASACWCGYSAGVGRAFVQEPMPNMDHCPVDWEPAVVRDWATWLTRIDAVLPPGVELEAFGHQATIENSKGEVIGELEWEDFPGLFEQVAKLAASGAHRRDALAATARPFTIQFFAGGETRAIAVAAAISAASSADSGFFVAGGFPANNPVAHIVVERDARGRELHKVLAGAFLSASDARTVELALEAETGVQGFVRPL